MQYSKLNTKQKKSNNYLEGLDDYDNWMSIDYSQETMAIARKRKKIKGKIAEDKSILIPERIFVKLLNIKL